MEDRKLGSFTAEEEVVSPPEEAEAPPTEPGIPAPLGDGIPDWAIVPKDLRVPKGRQVIFIKIRAALTDTPEKGERQAICWSLSDGDEKFATDRCEGKAGRASSEYTKQMIRAVDGAVVNWMRSRGPGSLDEFWSEIGSKGRNLLMRTYSKLHLADDDEVRDFFENCIAVRTSA